MECDVQANSAHCTCTNMSCSRRGKCCACIRHDRQMNQLSGCLFPSEAERTYDRSIAHFVRIQGQQ